MATKVIPNSLNYSDIKPESIDTEIKLAKFVPTATVTGIKSGEMIKFLLSGQGFFDPYSSYFKFTVKCNDLALGEVRTLDRSAHSFIQRIIIRSQGTELERIENYDVIAAMINDMIYSPEQNALHAWEGFPTHLAQFQSENEFYNTGNSGDFIAGHQNASNAPCCQNRKYAAQLNSQGASPFITRYVGECSFSNDCVIANSVPSKPSTRLFYPGPNEDDPGEYRLPPVTVSDAQDVTHLIDYRHKIDVGLNVGAPNLTPDLALVQNSLIPVDFAYHENGQRYGGVYCSEQGTREMIIQGTNEMTFIIPIYSGVIGVLMPDKKLLPLGLMPLDIEIYFNPHALYTNDVATGSRNYTITDFNMYSHMIFFESDIHKQLEAQTAEHGLFLYCNSFHTAPQMLISGNSLPVTAQISMNLKSINSVHFLFMYNHYLTKPEARKLHFVSHNLKQLRLRNGQQMIPQYAIEGHAGTSRRGEYVPFLLELMKAWNKLHDPKTDGAIQAYNFCGDIYGLQMDGTPSKLEQTTFNECNDYLLKMINKQGNVGRCQYGISLEGEELGQDKQMVTGRKTEYPFLIEMLSDGKCYAHDSFMYTFLRADFIIYIRPDLQIVTLGK